MAHLLEGIRVLDMTLWQQGPYATAMLADLGADVVKIEGPDSPDPARFFQGVVSQSPNPFYHSFNRNKRAICLDLKTEAGRDVLHHLTTTADVFATNLRAGALKRLGADYDTLSAINPGLIYARASGWGPKGPDADLGGMDILGQARGGLMSVTGDPDGPPKPAGVSLADHVGAITLAYGVMAALYHRERTGEGQEVDASLLGGQLCIQSHNITDTLWSGVVPPRRSRGGPTATWNAYQGSDGRWFAIGMNLAAYWPRLCAFLGRPEWLTDDRFTTDAARRENAAALTAAFDAIFATKPAGEWLRLFAAADLLAAPVQDYAEVGNDPQALANGYITEVDPGDGGPALKMVGVPVVFSKTPGSVRHLGPEFGEHTEDVLLEAGYDWPAIEGLRAAGAIGPRAETLV